MQRLLVLCAVLGIGLVVGLAVVSGTDHWRSAKPDTNAVPAAPLWACFKLEVWLDEESSDASSAPVKRRVDGAEVIFWCPPGDDVRVIQELGNGRRATLHFHDLQVIEEQATARSWGYDLNFPLESSELSSRCWPQRGRTPAAAPPYSFHKGKKRLPAVIGAFRKEIGGPKVRWTTTERFDLIDVAPVEEAMRQVDGPIQKAYVSSTEVQ